MPVTIDGTNGITTPTYGGTDTSEYLVPVTGFKNRIINGQMMIDQRNAGASVTNAVSGGAYVLDRWNYIATQASKFTLQQNAGSVTPPAGFTNYFGITSSSAYSVVSSDYFGINQQVEGFNSADLAWGTASAASVTLSFWVRSSLTGTFGGSISNNAFNRSYPFTYTISSANTWEQKTITIAGDTSGTWVGATNGIGIRVYLGIGVGSTYSGTAGSWSGNGYFSATGATSVVGTNGATFYITGVQLEKGSTATSFDYRPYGQELALCQRYYQLAGGTGRSLATNTIDCYAVFQTEMRATPSTPTAVNTSNTAVQFGRALTSITAVVNFFMASTRGAGLAVTVTDTGLTTNVPAAISSNALAFNAEL